MLLAHTCKYRLALTGGHLLLKLLNVGFVLEMLDRPGSMELQSKHSHGARAAGTSLMFCIVFAATCLDRRFFFSSPLLSLLSPDNSYRVR